MGGQDGGSRNPHSEKKRTVMFSSQLAGVLLSAGVVGARFAKNSGKVLPELCRFSAVRRLRREPGAEEGDLDAFENEPMMEKVF